MIAPPKTTLFQPDIECTKMYFLQKGKVMLFKRKAGKFEPDGVVGEGTVLAYEEFLSNGLYQCLAVCIETCEIYEIDRKTFEWDLQDLSPEIKKVVDSLPGVCQKQKNLEDNLTVSNSLPCLLFILNTFLDQNRTMPYRVSDIADQMESLYGIKFNDFCSLYNGVCKLGFCTPTFDDDNNDRLQIDNPAMLRRLYEYFRNSTSPKPKEGVTLTKMEIHALQSLLAASQNASQLGDKTKVPYSNFTEAAKQNGFEPKLCSRALSSLCLNNVINPVPNLGKDLSFSDNHNLVFNAEEIQQLVDLNTLIPKATTDFWTLCQS